MRYFLMGFMGAGKSFVGRRLAETLNSDFIDLDTEIEQIYGKTINEIFSEEGEDVFRQLERSVLVGTIMSHPNCVISTGGGAPCYFDNISIMNRNGITVYLNPPIEELVRRLERGKQHRPLIRDLSDEQLCQFILSRKKEREKWYKQCFLETNDVEYDIIINRILSETVSI